MVVVWAVATAIRPPLVSVMRLPLTCDSLSASPAKSDTRKMAPRHSTSAPTSPKASLPSVLLARLAITRVVMEA